MNAESGRSFWFVVTSVFGCICRSHEAKKELDARYIQVSEAEILETFHVAGSNIMNVIQWWASVSFSLIALAHLGRKILSLPLVVIALALYVVYSIYIGFLSTGLLEFNLGLVSQLAAMAESGAELSPASEYLIRNPNFGVDSFSGMTLIGTFFASIGYVVWVYLRNRRPGQLA